MSLVKVQEYFKKFNIEDKIIIFNESSATVSLAARALHTKEERIAKSLSFKLNNEVILIVLAGDAKISNSKYRNYFHEKAHMLSFDEVYEKTGHEVGGVCPFALNEGVKVYLDISLKRFKTVFPACGSHNSAIELTIDELEKYSNYVEWIDISTHSQ